MFSIDLVKKVYCQRPTVRVGSTAEFRNARAIASQLPKDLSINNPSSMKFERAVSAITSVPKKQLYTAAELREAILSNTLRAYSYQQCLQEYGIPEATLKRHINAVCKHFSLSTRKDLIDFIQQEYANEAKVRAYLDSDIAIPKPGPKHLLTQEEIDLLFVYSNKIDKSGFNQGKSAIAESARGLCNNKGDFVENNDLLKKKLKNAIIGKKWVRENAKRVSKSVLENGAKKVSFTKSSIISQKRAAACSPALAMAMEARKEAWYSELRAKGVLQTERPEPEDTWNGDEKGLKTTAVYEAGVNLGKQQNVRNFVTAQGEHSLFWTSIFYWLNGAGTMPIKPTIVHQGGTDTELPARFTHNLPPDWRVHCTQSGYMDRDGFKVCISSLVDYLKENNITKPQFVYIDGHDSHFCAEAMKFALDNNIYIFFLKSNDSINDQPCDMGPNAMLQRYYDQTLLSWQRSHPNVNFNAMFLNDVIKTAFNLFANDTKVNIY